jgi:hypothetical protein
MNYACDGAVISAGPAPLAPMHEVDGLEEFPPGQFESESPFDQSPMQQQPEQDLPAPSQESQMTGEFVN